MKKYSWKRTLKHTHAHISFWENMFYRNDCGIYFSKISQTLGCDVTYSMVRWLCQVCVLVYLYMCVHVCVFIICVCSHVWWDGSVRCVCVCVYVCMCVCVRLSLSLSLTPSLALSVLNKLLLQGPGSLKFEKQLHPFVSPFCLFPRYFWILPWSCGKNYHRSHSLDRSLLCPSAPNISLLVW